MSHQPPSSTLRLALKVTSTSEWDHDFIPARALVELAAALIAHRVRLSAVVRTEQAYRLSLWDYSLNWLRARDDEQAAQRAWTATRAVIADTTRR